MEDVSFCDMRDMLAVSYNKWALFQVAPLSQQAGQSDFGLHDVKSLLLGEASGSSYLISTISTANENDIGGLLSALIRQKLVQDMRGRCVDCISEIDY